MSIRSIITNVPQRWVVCVLCSWAFAIVKCQNTVYFSIANIVYSVTTYSETPTGGCPFLFAEGSLKLPFVLPDFFWNPKTVGRANFAYKTGKLWAVLPAGVLSDLGYSNYVLCSGLLLVSTGQLMLPAFAHLGDTTFMIHSYLQGIGRASVYTSVVSLISLWSLPSERNTFTAFIVAGLYCGDSFGHVYFRLIYLGFSSWNIGQYTLGAIGLVWMALCLVLVHQKTFDESLFITQSEYQAITGHPRRRYLLIKLHRLQRIPWCKIVTSAPFLSLILLFCSLGWVIYLNVWKLLALYQRYILHLPDKFSSNSTSMMVAVIPLTLMGGFLADWINKHKLTSKTCIKRTYSFISVFFPSVFLLTATSVGCNIVLFWILITCSVYTIGLASSVIYSTPVDLCPQYAGLMMGIITGAKTICSIINIEFVDPFLNHWMPDHHNPEHWRNKILSRSVISLAMVIPFLFFGSGEPQFWRRPRVGATRSVEQSAVEVESPNGPNPRQP